MQTGHTRGFVLHIDPHQALVKASMEPEANQDILDNVGGIVFLGTPHSGTQFATYAGAAARRLNRLASNPDIFLPLRVNSDELQILHDNFLWSFGELHMANFFETHQTPIIPHWCFGIPFRAMVRTTTSILHMQH